jgi:hypothetical protein
MWWGFDLYNDHFPSCMLASFKDGFGRCILKCRPSGSRGLPLNWCQWASKYKLPWLCCGRRYGGLWRKPPVAFVEKGVALINPPIFIAINREDDSALLHGGPEFSVGHALWRSQCACIRAARKRGDSWRQACCEACL